MMLIRKPDPILEWRRDYPFEDGWRHFINPHICHFGGSKQSSTTQTTQQVSQPWSGQQPYLLSGFSDASNLLNSPPPTQSFPIAGFDPAQSEALYGIENTARNGQPIAANANNFANGALTGGATGTGALQKFANGGYFSNGYSDDTAKQIASQVIPQVAASFNQGNNINNPAAAYAAGQGVTAALAPIEYQNYQTQEGLAQNAASTLGQQATQATALAPQTQGLTYADLQQLFNAGTASQTQAQNVASGQAQESNYAQLSPYQQLQAYISAVNGNYGQTTSGSTTTPYFKNQTADTLGTITGGAGLVAAALPLLAML